MYPKDRKTLILIIYDKNAFFHVIIFLLSDNNIVSTSCPTTNYFAVLLAIY